MCQSCRDQRVCVARQAWVRMSVAYVFLSLYSAEEVVEEAKEEAEVGEEDEEEDEVEQEEEEEDEERRDEELILFSCLPHAHCAGFAHALYQH